MAWLQYGGKLGRGGGSGDSHGGPGGRGCSDECLAPPGPPVNPLESARRRRQQLDVGTKPVIDGVERAAHAGPPTAALSLARAWCRSAFTVPSGRPSMDATSLTPKPA